MFAAKRSSGKFNTEMFDDVPVLQRKWQAALRPGEGLPRYEDVMLGSLGRLADHIVLLKNNDQALEVSRTGRYVQQWLNDERWDIPLTALSPDCATALGEAAANALANGRPYLATAHCVRDGLVRTYDVLALPTASRWAGDRPWTVPRSSSNAKPEPTPAAWSAATSPSRNRTWTPAASARLRARRSMGSSERECMARLPGGWIKEEREGAGSCRASGAPGATGGLRAPRRGR